MRQIENPRRGCGHVEKGGYYAQGELRISGTLSTWTWCLGDGLMGGHNHYLNLPPRQILPGNLPGSLMLNRYVGGVLTSALIPHYFSDFPTVEPNIEKLPPLALFDYVGAVSYSVSSFAAEVKQHGLSRRISGNIARAIAPYLPIPIFFAHAYVPIVHVDYREALIYWAQIGFEGPDDETLRPSYCTPNWGLGADDTHGDNHWLVEFLGRMDELGIGADEQKFRKALPSVLSKQVTFAAQGFGISWITDAVYVTTGEEAGEDLTELLEAGVEPVAL